MSFDINQELFPFEQLCAHDKWFWPFEAITVISYRVDGPKWAAAEGERKPWADGRRMAEPTKRNGPNDIDWRKLSGKKSKKKRGELIDKTGDQFI